MMHRRSEGFSLVELLVGVAVGLFIVATAAFALARDAASHKRLSAEVQVHQDLRSAADVIARELRRAGYWKAAQSGVWSETASAAANPFAAVLALPSCNSNATATFKDGDSACGVVFGYDDKPSTSRGGFRLRKGTIEMQFGQSWQALSDPGATKVTQLSFTMHQSVLDRTAFCASACPAAQPQCGPKQVVREVEVALAGESAIDAKVARSLTTIVRLRNDAPTGSCP